MEAIEAAADGDLGGEVEHAVDAGQGVGHGGGVADVAVHEARAVGHDLAPPDREVVEDRHLPAGGEQGAGQVRPDEAGAAGHEGVGVAHVALVASPGQ